MAVLSRIYFENIFCLIPFPKATNNPPRSEVGVKVALGDGGTFVHTSTPSSLQNDIQKAAQIQQKC